MLSDDENILDEIKRLKMQIEEINLREADKLREVIKEEEEARERLEELEIQEKAMRLKLLPEKNLVSQHPDFKIVYIPTPVILDQPLDEKTKKKFKLLLKSDPDSIIPKIYQFDNSYYKYLDDEHLKFNVEMIMRLMSNSPIILDNIIYHNNENFFKIPRKNDFILDKSWQDFRINESRVSKIVLERCYNESIELLMKKIPTEYATVAHASVYFPDIREYGKLIDFCKPCYQLITLKNLGLLNKVITDENSYIMNEGKAIALERETLKELDEARIKREKEEMMRSRSLEIEKARKAFEELVGRFNFDFKNLKRDEDTYKLIVYAMKRANLKSEIKCKILDIRTADFYLLYFNKPTGANADRVIKWGGKEYSYTMKTLTDLSNINCKEYGAQLLKELEGIKEQIRQDRGDIVMEILKTDILDHREIILPPKIKESKNKAKAPIKSNKSVTEAQEKKKKGGSVDG